MIREVTGQKTKIAALAAGSGGRTLALGLKELANVAAELYTIITDSGGSTRSWRSHGAPGDMRKQISTLMVDREMAAAFELRKEDGPFQGHPMGNQFIYALAEACGGDLDKAAEKINQTFELLIPVYPISNRGTSAGYPHLQGEWANGNTFSEEAHIDEPGEENEAYRIVKASLSEPVYLNPRLQAGLLSGEITVLTIGPGSLYGSTVAALLTSGLKEAIDAAPDLTVVYTCNMATRPGETTGMSVLDHFEVVNGNLGKHKVDIGIVSRNQPTKSMIQQYAEKGQELLNPTDDELDKLPCEVLQGNFLRPGAEGEAYHDPYRLAVELLRISKRKEVA